MGYSRRIAPALFSSAARAVSSPLVRRSRAAPLAADASASAPAWASRRLIALAGPTRVWCAKKRHRGLRKRAGGDGTVVSNTAATAEASVMSVLAPSVAPPQRPPPRNAKEAAEVASARLDHAIEENARSFVAQHQQQQQQEAAAASSSSSSSSPQKRSNPQSAASLPAPAAATTTTKTSSRKSSGSRGNRASKRRAAPDGTTSPTAPASVNAKPTKMVTDTSSSSSGSHGAATGGAPVTTASTASLTQAEDEAEAAAIAAAVEKVLNAAAAASSAAAGQPQNAHSESAEKKSRSGSASPASATTTTSTSTAARASSQSHASATTGARAASPAAAGATTKSASSAAATTGKTGKLSKAMSKRRALVAASRRGADDDDAAAADAAIGDGDDEDENGEVTTHRSAKAEAVARAREAIVSGKVKILAAAAAAVVTDAAHARAVEGEADAVAARPASVTSFASSLLGNDITLNSLTASSTPTSATATTPSLSTSGAPAKGAAGGRSGSASRMAKRKVKGKRAPSSQALEAPATQASASFFATPSSMTTAGGGDGGGGSSLATPAAAAATHAPQPRRRGRRLSDEAAANATATAIVRRLTTFTGLNREQQAKLKLLLLTRQQRLLRRRRRLLQRTRRAEAAAAAAAAMAGAVTGGLVKGVTNGASPGALERTMTSLAPVSSGKNNGGVAGRHPTRASAKRKLKARAASTQGATSTGGGDGASKPATTTTTTTSTSGKAVKPPKGPNPLVTPDYRERVLAVFERFAEVNMALGEKYKTQSYLAAVERLKKGDTLFQLLPPHLAPVDESTLSLYGTPEQVADFLRKRALAQTCEHVPGVGDKLKRKITTILETGGLAELDALEEKPIIRAIKCLTQVHGVGPRTAVTLYKDLGITTVDELKAYVEAQDKLTASGATSKSKKKVKGVFTPTDAQRLGLKYHKDILQRIPHSEGRLHEAFLKLRLKKHFGETDYELVVCGSYRRECPDSGDIDVLITTTSRSSKAGGGARAAALPPQEVLSAFLDVLRAENYVEATLAQGPTKFMGMCRLRTTKDASRRFPARRLDIRFVDADSFAAALLYFTGSKNFNVLMRAEAIKHNFVLNEYGLFRNQSSNTLATTRLHEAISKISKAQFYGGQPNDILKQQEKRLKEQSSSGGDESGHDAAGGASTAAKQKIYTKAELQELYSLWLSVEALRVKCKTEQDVFDAIGMDFVTPKDRNV